MPPPKVLILFNEPVLPDNHPDAVSENEILYTVDAVHLSLRQAGFPVVRLGVGHDLTTLVSGLRVHRPDVVFNLFEGTGDRGQTEAYAAGLLHWAGLPFTGSPLEALALGRCKHLTKHLLRGAGLPTAEFLVVDALPVPPCPVGWPAIVKPATQDASVGVDQRSVVTDQAALEARVALLLDRFGPPVLVEEYIPGREFSVPVIELTDESGAAAAAAVRPLQVSEIAFIQKDGLWPIVTYDAKWAPESPDYLATPPRYPAQIPPELAGQLQALAVRAFRLLGCRDYARIDFRVRAPDRPYILEINPNPDFSPDAGFSGGLTAVGLSHPQFTVQLVRNALARGGLSVGEYRNGRQPANGTPEGADLPPIADRRPLRGDCA